MLVYRVEDGRGRGPYCEWTIPPEIAYHHDSATGRPEMEAFRQLPSIEANSYKFGFISLGDLLSWFNGAVKYLINGNFFVSTYDVDGPILKDEFQCAFKAWDAHFIKSECLQDVIDKVYGPIFNPKQPIVRSVDGHVVVYAHTSLSIT